MTNCRLSMALILVAICSGCDKRASTANSGPVRPGISSPKAERKHVRSVPVLDTVEPDTLPANYKDDVVDPAPKFRPPDRRPRHDDDRLAEAGIQRYESKRLILYADIDADVAATLPPVVDQLFDALASYFGPLPPDEQGTEFQMTGYLIRDEILFRELGLLDGVPTLLHGKHLANRFWLHDQQHDYFRRHLLLHECVHCYMTFVPGAVPPVWYMEGMAELFATHRLRPDGAAEFRILPTDRDDMGGWGRIAAIRTLCGEQKSLTIRGVCDLPHEAFFRPQAYAWCWGLCYFFDAHPRYRERFKELGRHLADGQFSQRFHEHFASDERNLTTEWTLFEHQVQNGYDLERAVIEFQPAKSLAAGERRTVAIQAARGWQDPGLPVEPGEQYEIAATGRFTLADDAKPWISEPQGISIEYFNGSPLGRLVACLDRDPAAETDDQPAASWVHVVPIGKSSRWTVPAQGRLLLRLNDAWDSLWDNTGAVEVTIRRIEDRDQ